MKEFAKEFYKGKAWKACRSSYINKRLMIDGGMCERCGKRIGYIVHHKILLNNQNIKDPDISLNHCNLEYVCKECHDNIHYDQIHMKNAYVNFGKDGRIIPKDER